MQIIKLQTDDAQTSLFPANFVLEVSELSTCLKLFRDFHLARWIGCVESFIMENFSDIPCSMRHADQSGTSTNFSTKVHLLVLSSKYVVNQHCKAKEVRVKVASQFLSWYQVFIRGLEFTTDNKRTGLNLNTQVWFE